MDKLETERELTLLGYGHICGSDEVGRGPLAGPVVCAAVIMPLDDIIEGVDDSKRLTAKKREALAAEIKEKAVSYSICRAEPDEIDRVNILNATKACMKRAIEGLSVPADFAITDGNMTLDIAIPQRSMVKGDAKSYIIGAASILAKTYRDAVMREYDAVYPGYGFAKNMGYPTAEHIEAVKTRGLTPIHRRSFTKKWTEGPAK